MLKKYMGNLTFSNFNLYYKVKVIKMTGYWNKGTPTEYNWESLGKHADKCTVNNWGSEFSKSCTTYLVLQIRPKTQHLLFKLVII